MDITKSGEAPIACNQFMLSPFSPSFAFDIADYCAEHGIAVVAHSSLAGMEKNKALAHTTINDIKENNPGLKTPAQVLLKWALQMGFTVIPGSGNPKHQLSNLNIYASTLSKEEMDTLHALRDNDAFFYMDTRDSKDSKGTERADINRMEEM